MLDKYGWNGNYKLTSEDEANINKLLNPKGIQEDDSTPTPPEEKKKEIEKPEPEPEAEPEKEAKKEAKKKEENEN